MAGYLIFREMKVMREGWSECGQIYFRERKIQYVFVSKQNGMKNAFFAQELCLFPPLELSFFYAPPVFLEIQLFLNFVGLGELK